MKQPKTVICLRGLPGAGKSTLAEYLKSAFVTNGMDIQAVVVVSADQYFTDPRTGTYAFDETKKGQAHGSCFARFKKALADPAVGLIVVDNVNRTPRHFAAYKAETISAGCRWMEVTVGNPTNPTWAEGTRNIHGVPDAKVAEWARNWNWDRQPD